MPQVIQFNILLALKLCVQAWDAVTPRTISRCFQHAGFKYPNDTVLTPEEEEEEALPLSELARRLNSAGHLTEVGSPFTSESLDHALTEDEHLQTTGMSTLEDIASEVQGDSSVSENGPEEEADQDPPAIPQHSEFIKCLFASSQAKHRPHLINSLHQKNSSLVFMLLIYVSFCK